MMTRKDRFINKILEEHNQCSTCPTVEEVSDFFEHILGLLYVDFMDKPLRTKDAIETCIMESKATFTNILERNPENQTENLPSLISQFYENLMVIYDTLETDIAAILAGDPAANNRREVIRSYPGFYAIAAYRIANSLYRLDIADLPRIITEYAHSKTGIDIHPGATIGKSFCIDHGTGIVIGETAIIGNHVKIYQNVTLGALSVNKKDSNIKRHPTIEDGCILYAGSTILGGKTTVGKNSIIGGNVWLTHSIPPKSKIYYQAKMNTSDGETDVMVFKEFAK